MRVVSLSIRDFRCYDEARVAPGPGLTIVSGPNGAGKTNLLEALYFGCTGRSCRTANEREVVRFGQSAARVVVGVVAEDGPHQLAVGFEPGQPKRMRADGAPVERLLDVASRPLVSVFAPDRLELIKGAPSLRRAHLDQFVSALRPARSASRRGYAQALAQRNALLARIRSGLASRNWLATWDRQLAEHGVALMRDRAQAVEAIAGSLGPLADALGLEGEAEVRYRPRSQASTPEGLAAELAERVDRDLERGFTGHGPHRDDLAILHRGRELRAYGSQGQQRLVLLSLLMAEREAVAQSRNMIPLMLLDDVMSELDRDRRDALVEVLRSGGQSVVTTTDVEHVPGGTDAGVARIVVCDGRVCEEAVV